MLKNAKTLLLISTGVSLLLAEVISIVIMPTDFMRPYAYGEKKASKLHQRSEVPGLDYELRPNRDLTRNSPREIWTSITVRTNSFGMRSKEPVKPDAGDICTVAVLGDSFAFGISVDQHLIYPSILEKIYQEKYNYRAFQVLNFAVKGYGAREEALVLEYKVLPWEPDLIIVGYYLNDPELRYPFNLGNYFRKPEWWQYSNVFRLIAKANMGRKIRNIGGGDYFIYLHAENGEFWGSVISAFEIIGRLAGDNNIPVLLVIFPEVNPATWQFYPYEEIHSQVTREAERNGFTVLDLREVYRVFEAIDLMVEPGDQHPSDFGHSIAAAEIFRTIEDEDLLACP